jgi:hypothetical protein
MESKSSKKGALSSVQQWELHNGHLASCLLNYGARPALLCREELKASHLLPALPLPGEPIPLTFLLSRGLRFLKDIVRWDNFTDFTRGLRWALLARTYGKVFTARCFEIMFCEQGTVYTYYMLDYTLQKSRCLQVWHQDLNMYSMYSTFLGSDISLPICGGTGTQH